MGSLWSSVSPVPKRIEGPEVRPYTRRDLALAANLSALLGWLAVSAPVVWLVWPLTLFFAALIGLPIALVACWLIGVPILWRLMRSPITWFAAAGWGAAITGPMAALGIAFCRFARWRQPQDLGSKARSAAATSPPASAGWGFTPPCEGGSGHAGR